MPFAVDEAHFAGVGDQDLVAALLEQTTHPGRVGAGLDRAMRIEAMPEKRLWKAFWLVGMRLSSIIPTLAAFSLSR